MSTKEPNISRDILVGDLRSRLAAVISPHVTHEFALLDFPNHHNVGDSGIWLGEIEFFKSEHGAWPGYVSAFNNFDGMALRRAVPDGAIFLHGGGNFGDIWNQHQNFREHVISTFPDRPIIQLPQSIHYGDPSRVPQTASVIAKHPNFVLLVRDQESLRFAEKHFDCRVELCPDSAFSMRTRQAGGSLDIDILAMLRTDKERAADIGVIEPGIVLEDWLNEDVGAVRRQKLNGMIRAWLLGRPDKARLFSYNAAARLRVERGFAQIGRARGIVTDRLHVHIFSLLLGRRHAVLDNSYGKIARFMAAFSGGTPLSYQADDFNDAIRWLKSE